MALITRIEPRYTEFGLLIAFRVALRNNTNQASEVEVFVFAGEAKDTAKDDKAQQKLAGVQGQQRVEFQPNENKEIDVVIQTPVLIKSEVYGYTVQIYNVPKPKPKPTARKAASKP
jgi:hypothetical protein